MRALSSFLFAIRAARRRGPSLSGEEGSLLVEVLVGALVLGITSLAILDGLDGAQKTGIKNKARTEYANLAQQDIERMRSMPIPSIANLDETRTVRVGSVNYSVHSETEWTLDDPTGVVSCTDYNPLSEYLRITSSVSSPGNADNPVSETTLLTPAPGVFGDSGTATVLVTDRDGSPQSGLTVRLTGPGSYTETTNALGCAVFRYIEAGSYTAEVTPGVSWASELPATAPVTVNGGRTTLNPIEVDDPASLRAHFITPTNAVTDWSRISVAHAKLPAGFKVFPSETATTKLQTLDADQLYPHRDAYGVYAGSCESNNPAVWDSDYFQPGVPGYVELDPGASLVDVNVRMASLTIRLDKRNLLGARFHVSIKQVQSDGWPECADSGWDFTLLPTAVIGGVQIQNAVSVTHTFQLPFGRYKVCVDDGLRHRVSGSGSSSSHYSISDASTSDVTAHRMTTASNGSLTQSDRASISSTSSGNAGMCPAFATW